MKETFVSDKDKLRQGLGRQKEGSSQNRWKRGGTRKTVIGRDPGNRHQASGKDAEAGRAMGAVGTGGTKPCGMGRVVGPPSPPAPRRRGPVTKLPNYRRIPELLTGEDAANQRAAPLFSGRRPGDTRTFPHPGSR